MWKWQKKEQALAGGMGNQLPLSYHTTPAAPLTSFRGPGMLAEPQLGPHTFLMPPHRKGNVTS